MRDEGERVVDTEVSCGIGIGRTTLSRESEREGRLFEEHEWEWGGGGWRDECDTETVLSFYGLQEHTQAPADGIDGNKPQMSWVVCMCELANFFVFMFLIICRFPDIQGSPKKAMRIDVFL